MSRTIGHCTSCGNIPMSGAANQVRTLFYAPYCQACGKCAPEDEQEWSTEEKAIAAWNRALLADLAAQERELWVRIVTVADSIYIAPQGPRDIVENRYVWLGQRPLSLPPGEGR